MAWGTWIFLSFVRSVKLTSVFQNSLPLRPPGLPQSVELPSRSNPIRCSVVILTFNRVLCNVLYVIYGVHQETMSTFMLYSIGDQGR